jgi:hypothetical protein
MNNIYNLFKFLEKKDNKKIPFKIKLLLNPDDITENDLTVNGDLDLSNTNITKLPDNLTVQGTLNLAWSKITELPDNLAVEGNLYLYGTNIVKLPNTLTVKGEIYKDF